MSLLAEKSLLVFLILTVVIGGGAAWLAGRALALKWRPFWQVVVYSSILACGVRFFHFALFEETLLSLHYYLVAAAVLILSAGLSFRMTRARQMTTQYRWLYERTSPLTWRDRS